MKLFRFALSEESCCAIIACDLVSEPPSIIIGKTNESRVQKNTFYDGFALVGTDAEPFL